MSLLVYVAAPYPHAAEARAAHAELRSMDMKPTSSWAEEASGLEVLSDAHCADQRRIWDRNVEDLSDSHALLALSQPSGGGEFFVEVGLAIGRSIPVLWVGTRRVLSCYSGRVRVFSTLMDALVVLGRANRLGSYDRTAIRAELIPHFR